MRTLVIFLLLTSVAWANDVAVCDPTHPVVPNAVTRFRTKVDVPPTPGFVVWVAPTNLDSPARTAYLNGLRAQLDSLLGARIPSRYWVCTDTNPADGVPDGVREMTPTERGDLDQFFQDAEIAGIRQGARDPVDTFSPEGIRLRAALLVILDEFNRLRQQHGLPPRTVQQLKNAIKNRIDAGDAD